jgi:LysM domain
VERSGRPELRPGPAWWGWGRVPGVAACLLLLERALVGVVGTPVDQLAVLGQLRAAPADPVAPVIAALAFMAEVLVGYLLGLLVLRSLSLLPGSAGRLTGQAMLHVSPRTLHRLLDLLVGGALLAQATLATMPGMPAGREPSAGLLAAASHPPVPRKGPARARPSPRRLAAPLPPWLEGGPSNPAPGYTVKEGDTLWDIAASHLAPAERSASNVHRHWQRIYRANRPVIGDDPDLILPGTRLAIPPPGDGRP